MIYASSKDELKKRLVGIAVEMQVPINLPALCQAAVSRLSTIHAGSFWFTRLMTELG